MKALISNGFDGIESLQVQDIKSRALFQGEIRVSIRAVGLNFFDTLIVKNRYQVTPELPFSPGAEFCGDIVEISEPAGNAHFKLGMRVVGYIPYGACREEVIVQPHHIIPVPEEVSDQQAAGVMVTYGTTLYALQNRGLLKSGETLLVLGASGGVGLAAIEIGKILGAKVIAAASSPEKLEICKQHGADILLQYGNDVDLKQAIRDATDGKGADVIYDPVGGPYAEPAIRATNWAGRYLVIGFAAGDIPKIPLNLAMLKNMAIVGVFWGAFTQHEPQIHQQNMAQILKYVADGRLKVHVGKTYTLNNAKQAIEDLKNRRAVGKLIVEMSH